MATSATSARNLLLGALLAAGVPTKLLPAQGTCPNFGGLPRPARLEPSPVPLGCAELPTWPQWHLWTPAHDAPGRHPGFRPGRAIEFPRLLVAYRCTGLWLVPVVPSRVRTMGYVIHQPEQACGG